MEQLYSYFALVLNEGWLVGDEGGNIWCRSDDQATDLEPFENILEFESGVSDIAPLDRSKVLIGEMRGNITQVDLNYLSEETIRTVKGINHRAPIKCIRWQPNQSEIFATASQDGSVLFSDLRSPDTLLGSLNNPHYLNISGSKGRSSMTGLVFNPLRPELFYTTGTPDTCIRLWDMRKLSYYTNSHVVTTTRRSKKSSQLCPVEEFSTASYSARKHRSSVALTIDSIGSRLFLATSNDNIFEFLTNNPELGPVASYSAPNYNSCSFFSNLSIDPTDRFLLSGSSSGQAYIWDTFKEDGAFELPVCAQLEVSKTGWAGGKKGSLDAQIACISDDLTFSLFNWNLNDANGSFKRPKQILEVSSREIIHKEDPIEQENITISNPNSNISSAIPSIPVTPIRKQQSRLALISPNSANKSILDFFSRSPRVGQH